MAKKKTPKKNKNKNIKDEKADFPLKFEGQTNNNKEVQETTTAECKLECTKDKKQVDYVEYVGPVHISLIDPPGYVYRKTMVETALLNLAYFLIGATAMFTLYYTLMVNHHWAMNLHIFLGTLGSQIFMPAFFLTLNPLDGGAMFTKSTDKRKSACLLNIVAVCCIWAATGSLANYWKYFIKFSFHSIAGFIATACCFFNFLTCCCIHADEDSTLGQFVQFISVPAYVFSTATFVSGMFEPSMVRWYPEKQMPEILTLFCVVYSVIIIYRPIKNFFELA